MSRCVLPLVFVFSSLLLGVGCASGSADDLDVQLELYKVYRIDGSIVESDDCTACPLLPGEELEFFIRWTNNTGDWIYADLPNCEDLDPATGESVLFDNSTGQHVPVTCEDRVVQEEELAPEQGIYGTDIVFDTHVARLFVSKSDILDGAVPLSFGQSLEFRYDGHTKHFNIVDASW